jgi:hypothetical protein
VAGVTSVLHDTDGLAESSCPYLPYPKLLSLYRVAKTNDFCINRSRMNLEYLPSCNDSKTREEVLLYYTNWNTQMVELSRQLIRLLSGTVEAWGEFQRKEIGYFLYDGESPTASPSLRPSLDNIDRVFSNLKGCLRKLHDFEKELREDHPHGVSRLSY